MYSKIIAKIRTKEDAQNLENELDQLKNSLYLADKEAFQKTLDKKVRSWVSADLKEGLSKAVDQETYLKGLIDELSKLKPLSLTIPFDLTQESLDRIHGWVKDNVGAGIILDITVEPSILGGAKIIYNGHYHDSSLTTRFKKVFSEQNQTFNQILSQ